MEDGIKILVADDFATMRKVIKNLLKVSFRQACVKNFNYAGKIGYQPNKEDNQWNRSLQGQGH